MTKMLNALFGGMVDPKFIGVLGAMAAMDTESNLKGVGFAFDGSNFDPGASPKGAPNKASYSSPDELSVIETDGYFDDKLVSTTLKTGDFLSIYSSAASGGGAKIYNVTVSGTDVALTLTIALA